MGVPAFYRWLTEKYPKIVQDVVEERVPLAPIGTNTAAAGLDISKANPSGLECHALYLDLNGIIHPCSHPETGPQPATEADMFDNICRYIDRLMRAIRPRQLLYVAIDGVAPRAKMNQQRARRFRSAQEAREYKELERQMRQEIQEEEEDDDGIPKEHEEDDAWDSNVITPGTPFMLRLSTFVRFYIRKRLSHDRGWKGLQVIFSDASIPGEGEHKIMSHIRLQRAQPGYDPNRVHVLHGLDADLIMLALATHEVQFYISREQVLFGRKSHETMEARQAASGHKQHQLALNESVGDAAMQLSENAWSKPLERVSIPILREYWTVEFAGLLNPERLPNFAPNLERLIDDLVFLCFFVGNDFLPHLPSLDIRDGALDYLFNVYQRLLPTLPNYITKSGGHVHLPSVSLLLQQVGAIEDYVFSMKHDKEQQMQQQRAEQKKNNNNKNSATKGPPPPPPSTMQAKPVRRGRAAQLLADKPGRAYGEDTLTTHRPKVIVPSHSRPSSKSNNKVTAASLADNQQAAMALQQALQQTNNNPKSNDESAATTMTDSRPPNDNKSDQDPGGNGATEGIQEDGNKSKKRKADDSLSPKASKKVTNDKDSKVPQNQQVGMVGEAQDEFDKDDDEDEDEDDPDAPGGGTNTATPSITTTSTIVKADRSAALAVALKERVKAAQQKQLDEYAANVKDNVRLHEAGWKDRYYTDKCKAEDVAAHGGREHLFRSYVVGLCWVMKYYYDGCPSWKWYYPFHYAPFASDLQNIERFQKDVRALELSKPFNPVEQLMAVLPSDSAHAIPQAARWLMCDPESPIIDFYPKDVPVDPNGKAMPWLWVVLLPFIEEERLLDAMMPTMSKWTKEELLCNARGMDDGYLYVHKSHGLVKKLAPVVAKGKSAKDPKTRLTNTAAYGVAGFSGSVRAPLSNELYPVETGEGEELTVVKLPPTASSIENPGSDGLFTEDLEGNLAVCVAFSEPSKLPHKSVLLPGARPMAPVLTEEDKQIRKPRLGKGGSIANMGGGNMNNNNSHQSGYGSMNIGSYERDLAGQTGRGNQMYQAGTRSWGAMEPTPKNRRPPPPPPPNPFLAQPNQQQQPPPPQRWPSSQGNHLQQQQHYNNNSNHERQGYDNYYAQRNGGSYHQQQRQWQQPSPTGYGNNNGRSGFHPNNNNNRPGYGNDNHSGRSGSFPNQSTRPQQPPPRGPPPQQQQQPQHQGFSFRNQMYGAPAGRPNQPPQQQRSRASADAMQTLRAQLSNTLMRKQTQNGSSGQGNTNYRY